MLSKQRQNSQKIINFDTESPRQQRWEAYQAKRDALATQQRVEKAEKQARVNQIVERWEHALILSDLCKRLALVYAIPCQVNNVTLFNLLEVFNWKCPASGQVHSMETPISLDFVNPLECGGSITINNIKPKYYKALLAGEWTIRRDNVINFPPLLAPKPLPATIELTELQGAA
jgi:hypothetical protein